MPVMCQPGRWLSETPRQMKEELLSAAVFQKLFLQKDEQSSSEQDNNEKNRNHIQYLD